MPSCRSETADKDLFHTGQYDNVFSYYRPVPTRPALVSKASLNEYHDTENNIRFTYIFHSNKYSYPVNYGISSCDTSLTQIVFEKDGILPDYTPGFDEIIMVREGIIRLVVDSSHEYILNPSDTIHLRSNVKRRIINDNHDPAVCLIIARPPYNPGSLDEKPVTINEENKNELISPVIRIEDMDFLETDKPETQRIFHPETHPAGIMLGMIIFPPRTRVQDISLNSESIFFATKGELIVREREKREIFVCSPGKFLFVPENLTVDIHNNSNDMVSLLYFYPSKMTR